MAVIEHPALITEEKWHTMRQYRIGASEAASIYGLNKWTCTNVKLWQYKTGLATRKDISDVPIVKYGLEAESHLRGLYELDWRDIYEVHYRPFDIRIHPVHQCMCATLDGWLIERETGRIGILEIKAGVAHNAAQWDSWKNKVPQKYYVQLCAQAACIKADFAVLHYQLKNEDKAALPMKKIFATRNSYIFDSEQFNNDVKDVETKIPQWYYDHIYCGIKPELNSI